MISRLLKLKSNESYFLFGPRGTGKSTWIQEELPNALVFDLLEDSLYQQLASNSQRLGEQIPSTFKGTVVIDEIQKIPSLLDEVHRLIEKRKLRFLLTGSSARKLRRASVNLLAGRALEREMFPLTALELGSQFNIQHALKSGLLPKAYLGSSSQEYLKSYISTYLKIEVQQEALTRNIALFSRFLEAAAFSQASVLNISKVAEDCGIERRTVQNYFDLLEDLLLAFRIPVFQKKAKRRMVQHPKFFYFDCGVYRSLRAKGPLDAPEEIDGAALETLVLQEMRALNSYLALGYDFYFWRSSDQKEVDFVLYGERGILAFEVKRSSRFNKQDLSALRLFLSDYPEAKGFFLYGGDQELEVNGIQILPLKRFFQNAKRILS